MSDLFELYYGAPGSAKTRSVIELAKEVAANEKKIRVYTGDGSKILYDLALKTNLLPKDSLAVMDFVVRDYPFTTLQQITEGFWPENADDPKSKMRALSAKEVSETGLWVFEGASVAGNYMLGDAKGGLAQRAADGETLGQEANVKFTDSSEYKFGGNAAAHYNIAQRHILADILRSKALPGMVIWTAHERMDDGERGGSFAKGSGGDKYKAGEKTIGPEVVGKAMTSWISREFGNTLHFTTASKRVQDGTDPISGKTKYLDKLDYRVYTRDHYDPDGVVPFKYLAISRSINPTKVADHYTSTTPGAGLVQFYQDLNESNK